MYWSRYACFGCYVVHSMVCVYGTSREQRCFVGYAGASGVVLRCFARVGRLVLNVPRWIRYSAGVLGCHVTVASIPPGAGLKCVCSHQCCSRVAWAVGVWWCRANSWRMDHDGASAWGPHRQHVVGMPVGGFCGNGGGKNLRAVGGDSIHELPCALPGRSVTLRALNASRTTTGTVVSEMYPT